MNKNKHLDNITSNNYSGEGDCRKSNIVAEIFEVVEKITDSCIEEEYSTEYGFASRSWFNITKFKKSLARLKKKYERNG